MTETGRTADPSTVDRWLAVLDGLLARPLPVGRAHRAVLAQSPEFREPDGTGADGTGGDGTDGEAQRWWTRFTADRERLAAALHARYGPPRRADAWHADDDPLLAEVAGWSTERVDVWRAGDRRVVAEVGQDDRELPVHLSLVVGRRPPG